MAIECFCSHLMCDQMAKRVFVDRQESSARAVQTAAKRQESSAQTAGKRVFVDRQESSARAVQTAAKRQESSAQTAGERVFVDRQESGYLDDSFQSVQTATERVLVDRQESGYLDDSVLSFQHWVMSRVKQGKCRFPSQLRFPQLVLEQTPLVCNRYSRRQFCRRVLRRQYLEKQCHERPW